MIDRLRRDDGFTLIELLAAMAIGGVVLTALMGVFINGTKATTKIQNRVDNTERARYALDRIVRLLDAQVCTQVVKTTDVTTAPVFANSDQNSVTFYADLDGASGSPEKYKITFLPKSGSTPGRFTVDTYAYNSTADGWTTQVGPTATLVSDVIPAKDPNTGVDLPVFTYYPYVASATDPAQVGGVSTNPAGTPLSTSVAPTVVKVGVEFTTISSTSHVDDNSRAVVSGSGTLSTFDADPTAPTACP
ncbi:PilW family protein [Baekduia alba]|uniref:PilW family protein n=1 Tax=Baekduia alba TaxID=2997333 RepID=UPI00234167D6|nr:prepilin-type N-terminal cleavage/methylation domain-containing protein [Baekduia alba]